MNKKATISDVSLLAKTGKTSVSRYLNGEHHLLSYDLRERIEKAVKELNYKPSLLARSLKKGRTKLIGILLADINNPYSIQIINGIEKYCRENNFIPIVFNTDNNEEQESKAFDMLAEYQADGVIVNAPNSTRVIGDYNFPIVLINRKLSDYSFDMSGIDNYHAVSMAIAHIIDNGFNNVTFISEPINNVYTRTERQHFFFEEIKKHPDVNYAVKETTHSNKKAIRDILHEFYKDTSKCTKK